MIIFAFIQVLIAFIAAPLLLGLINRTKAIYGGRKGQPLLQAYYDIAKLLKKDFVYSRTTTWIFPAGPPIIFSAVLLLSLLIPSGQAGSIIYFPGDIILIVYLFGISRFFMICSALDTGSSFEGMGASREAQFSLLAEPATFFSMIVIAFQTKSFSLSGMLENINWNTWSGNFPSLLLVIISLFIVMLAENSRIPFDDPNTHLELTMIHEVMILDHSGPDLGIILYSSSLKLWLLSAVIINIMLPVNNSNFLVNQGIFLAGIAVLAITIGVVESVMARIRLIKVPKLLIIASFLSILALVFIMR